MDAIGASLNAVNSYLVCIMCLALIQAYLYFSPVCSLDVPEQSINLHLDNGCSTPSSSSLKSRVSTSKHTGSQATLAPIFGGKSTKPGNDQIIPHAPKNLKRKAEPDSYASTKRKIPTAAPLAERLRPQTLDEFVGQQHLLGKDSLLTNSIKSGNVGSMILWGPPG